MSHACASRRGRTSLSTPTTFAACFASLLIAQCLSPVLAQDLGNPKYQFQRRSGPDRQEGIKGLERSGTYLDLVSVDLDAPGATAGQSGNTYQIGLFLAEAEGGVRITVRDYNKFIAEKYHYWMIPSQVEFPRGFQQFAWDAGLARELGIKIEDLGAVALLGGHTYRMVAPLVLQAAQFPARIQARGVRFVFVPNETVTVHYQVYPKGRLSRILLESSGETWHKDQRSTVSWNGLDRDGRSVGEGQYVLALTATVKTLQGFEEKIPLDYVFYYAPQIVSAR